MNTHLLSILIFLPLVLAGLLSLMREKDRSLVFTVGLAGSVLEFLLSLLLFKRFDVQQAGIIQFKEAREWIPDWGIGYVLGVDGFSLFLILMTTFLVPLVLIASMYSIEKHFKLYTIAFLALEAGIIGALCALDLFLFYVFWEVMLIPMFLIIGIWGGTRRIYATVKFVIFTMAGSLLMLIAILATGYFYSHQHGGQLSFNVLDLYDLAIPERAQLFLFFAFVLAFAIKVPLFPFHTWLPAAHVEAPTGGSVILAAVLLKLGGYGMLRFAYPLFPIAAAKFTPHLLMLAVIGIIYGALISRVQPDLKKLVAFSSVSHLGFAVLGIGSQTEIGILGANIGMLSHGLTTGGLFFMVGMIYDRRHTRMLDQFGGLMISMPRFSWCFRFLTLASVGLPGLSGFVGEFLVLLGAFQAEGWSRTAAVLASPVLIFSAVYLLWMYQKVCMGTLDKEENKNIEDLGMRELGILAPLFVFILWMGIHPHWFGRYMQPPSAKLAQYLTAKQQRPKDPTIRYFLEPRADAPAQGEETP